MPPNLGKLRRLDPRKTIFLLCDIQEQFRKVMPLFDPLIKNVNKLLKAGKQFEVPLIVSEQYPEKLGKTVKEFDIEHACAVVGKTKFSMFVPEIETKLLDIFNNETPNDAVLFGLECHVCVEQTAMDLIDNNINVFVVADCCCSRLNVDRDLALKRLQQNNCIVTTSESIIFNLLQDKNNPNFNNIRKIVAEVSADMQLTNYKSSN